MDLFSPFVVERFTKDDPRWLKLVTQVKSENRRFLLKKRLLGWLPRVGRTQRAIEKAYSWQWSSLPLEEQLKSATGAPFEWQNEGLLANTAGIRRIYHFLLSRTLEKLQPKKVLEVGFGNGINLFLLAARLPSIQFSGVELTRGGFETARQICSLPELPPFFQMFAVDPLRDLQAHRRLDLHQANATALPFADKSFDLVFTVLALEQMEEIRNEALQQISRVASRYVVMVEPFRDWNADGWRRDYIAGRNYFSAWISDLKKFGLQPVLTRSLPHKLAFTTGLVICEIK